VTSSTTGTDRHIGMKLGWRPAGVTLVASGAIVGRRNMFYALASCLDTVMATRAISRAGKRAVIGFGALPFAAGLVATLASGSRG
jgi:hypothetical protein